jgi:hypothetical protein
MDNSPCSRNVHRRTFDRRTFRRDIGNGAIRDRLLRHRSTILNVLPNLFSLEILIYETVLRYFEEFICGNMVLQRKKIFVKNINLAIDRRNEIVEQVIKFKKICRCNNLSELLSVNYSMMVAYGLPGHLLKRSMEFIPKVPDGNHDRNMIELLKYLLYNGVNRIRNQNPTGYIRRLEGYI